MANSNTPPTELTIAAVEYEVPLTASELLDLGRVTAILSQIDSLLTEVLSSASKTPAWAVYIFAEKATMSAKIAMLDNILGGLSEADAKRTGKKLVKALHRVNDDRNILFHGMWAYHMNPNTKRGFPACIWQKKTPIRPAELPEVAERAALVSRQLGDFLGKMNPLFADPPWSAPRRLFIATDNVDLTTFSEGNLTRASQ
jgi:hypothetical protein